MQGFDLGLTRLDLLLEMNTRRYPRHVFLHALNGFIRLVSIIKTRLDILFVHGLCLGNCRLTWQILLTASCFKSSSISSTLSTLTLNNTRYQRGGSVVISTTVELASFAIKPAASECSKSMDLPARVEDLEKELRKLRNNRVRLRVAIFFHKFKRESDAQRTLRCCATEKT